MTEQPNNTFAGYSGTRNGQAYDPQAGRPPFPSDNPVTTPFPQMPRNQQINSLQQWDAQTPPGYRRIWWRRDPKQENLIYWKPDAQYRYRPDMPPAVWDSRRQFQGYWDDPKNVVKAYNYLRVQDDDFEPPSFMDPDFVQSMYKALAAYNGTQDTALWKPLPYGSEESYYAYAAPGPDWWESNPNNRHLYPDNPQKVNLGVSQYGLGGQVELTTGVTASIENVQAIIDEVNAELAVQLQNEQITQDEYDQSVKYFSQYALSEEGRAYIGQNMTAEQLAAPFDPRDYSALAVTGLLEQQGVLDLNGKPFKEYTEMEPFAKVLLTLFGAPENLNAPEYSKQISAGVQGGMAGLGAWGAVMTYGAIAAKVSAGPSAALFASGVGAPVAVMIPIIAFAVAGVIGYLQYASAITGRENFISKGFNKLMNFFAEGTERVVGTATIMSEIKNAADELKATGASEEEISKTMLNKYGVTSQDFWENFGRAWTTSRMYYESSGGKGAGDWLVDTVSTAAHALDKSWSSGKRTAPGEVWQLQLGKDSPSTLGLNSVETRAAIMRDIYALGPNPDRQSKEAVFAMWQDALGMSGNMNDFVGQMFIDPLNFAPAAVNKGLDIHAQKQFKIAVAADDLVTARWYANLSEAAKHAPGNPIIDSLPFGVQNIVEGIFRVASRTPKGTDAPRWLRGTINPVSTWYAAAGNMGSGYQPKMIVDLMNDMRAKGYSAPVGSTVNVSGGTPGMTPTVKVFISSDRMHAQFSLIGTDGSVIGRQFISSDGNLPFVDVDDVLKQFKEMISTDSYKSQFPDDGFGNALIGDLKVEHSSTITYSDYVKSYADQLTEVDGKPTGSPVYDDMLNSIGKPVIVDAGNGIVISDAKLVIDSFKDDIPEYQVISADGKTLYTVQASNDEVISIKTDGQDVPLPEGGLLVSPYRVAELSDPAVSRVNINAVNDLAEALGVPKPYPTNIDLVGSKPLVGAEPTKLTGNKINDYFLKLNDYTPESKIAITNRAITQTILGALMIAKNDPDKFFAFFDYLAGKPVEVSPAMKNWAAGKVVATAMLTLKSALKDGSSFAMLRTAWETSTVRRVEVTNFARILEIPPEKLVTMKSDDILKKLNAYNARVSKTDPTKVLNMTAAEIKKFLSPYTGADALPLTKKSLVDRATFAFISDSEKAAIQMFDPQVKSGLTQFSSMLKSIIGLPLISANPGTWMMNAFNNWVTMNIMVGTGGLTITNKAMRDSIARMGVDYTLLVGNQFKVGENEILASKELQEILNPDNWMTDVKRFMSRLSSSEKTPLDGLARAAGTKPEQLIEMGAADIVKAVKKSRHKKFARLSEAQISRMIAPYVGDNAKPLTKNIHNPLATYGKIEQFFAIRTMKLAVDRMMGRTPLSTISDADRAALKSYGMTDRQVDAFQKAADRAYNMDEILSFFKDGEIKYNPVPVEIIDAALDKLSGGDPAQRAAIDDLLDFNGLRDDLTDMLSKPRSPEEVEAIQGELFDKLTDVADQTRANNLAAEFVKVTEDTSGHIGLLKNLYMIAQQEYQTLYNANRQFGVYWDAVDQAAKTMPTPELRAYKAAMWEITSRAVKKMWDSTYKVMLNGITAGMQKVGLGEDGDFFVNNLAERLTMMRDVYAKIQKINDDAHDGVIKNTDIGKLLNQIYAEYRKARDVNQKAWVDKIVELYDKNGVPLSGMTKEQMHARMVGFMGEFLKRDRTFRNKVLDHRRMIESMDYSTKRAANKAFYEGTYQAESLDMLKFLTNEAYENFNTQRTPKHTSKGAGQTSATKPKAKTPSEAAVENTRSIFNRNETAAEHTRMMNDQVKAAYGQYNKQMFHNELNAATNLTESQRFAAAAYFDAFDATVKRLSNGEFGFYDRVGSIDAFEGDYLPQDRFTSPSGERYIAAMTYGPDGKFILNFATESADAVSVWHEGSHAIVDTARRLYEMGVFDDYKLIIETVGKTTVEAFNAMDGTAKGEVYDAIADSMFKWQSDIEVAKSMPTGLKAAFTTMAKFFADLIKGLFKRYKDVEVTPAVKEVYRSLFVHNEASAKADRNATRIRQYREGTPFKVYGAKKGSSYELIPVVVDANLVQPSHDLGGFKNPDFPENFQPREYSLSFVMKQAPVLNPELLLNRPVDMSSGSPVIDQYGNVIAGNHRVGILMMAKESYPDSWRKYQEALPGALERYGLTQADLDGIENPVLVYRIADESYAQSFVDQANVSNQQVMSPTEQAKRFGKALPLDLLTGMKFGENVSFADVVRSPELADLRKAFIESLYDAEQEQFLISENGYATNILTAAGEQALGQAILARAYGGTPEGERLIKAIIGDDKGVFAKNLTEALVQTAPAAIKIDSLIAAGKLDPSYSITARLSDAVTEYTIWTRRPSTEKHMTIADYGNTLTRQTPEIVIKMEEFFNNNIRSSKRMANLFNLFAEEAVKGVKQPSAEAESMLIPGLTFEAEKTVEVRDADTILSEMLDKANATSQYEVKIDAANENVNVILNNTIDNWGEVLKTWFEPLLTRMKKDISKSPAPTVPPDWANVEGLYSGDTYKPLITTIDEILNGKEIGKFSYPGMRELILQQAHNLLIAEDVKYRMHNGMMDSPEADFIRANKAANALNRAVRADGTDAQKYEALATPLKEALALLDEIKSRNGHPQSIAALEAAIAAAPVKPLTDADVSNKASIPLMITRDMSQQLADLGYSKDDQMHMNAAQAWEIIESGTFNEANWAKMNRDLGLLGYKYGEIVNPEEAQHIIDNQIQKAPPTELYDKLKAEYADAYKRYKELYAASKKPGFVDAQAKDRLHDVLAYAESYKQAIENNASYLKNMITLEQYEALYKMDYRRTASMYSKGEAAIIIKNNITYDEMGKLNELGYYGADVIRLSRDSITDVIARKLENPNLPAKPLSDGDIAANGKPPAEPPVDPEQPAFFQPSDLGYRSGESVFEHYEIRLFDDDMNRSKTIIATTEEAAKNMLERSFNSTWRTYAILKVTDDYSKPGNPGHRFEIIDEMRTPDPNRPYRKPPSPPEYYPSGDPNRGIFFQPGELTYQPGESPLPPVTADPPQGPQSINQSSAIDQLANNEIMNLVGEITDGLQGYMRDNATFDMEKGIPEQALPILQKIAAGWENELDVKKLTAIEYAKLTRDHTLLDYTARRGIDQLIQHVFPYHFWYTSSVTEWAKHMIGDPTVGAAYAQYQELRRKNGMLGFPSRMAGKMWIPAAWLPDYLGDELFLAPFSRLMPLESIVQPVSLFTDLSSDMTASTVRIINQWVREKLVSPDQAAAAIQNGSGAIWEDALAQAIQEDEGTLNDTVTLASQLMGVAPWWQYAYYFMTDQKEKISVLPTTKVGQALSSFRSSDMEGGGGTWAGDMVSVIGNIIKAPEEKVRDMLDMSAYGEPGDYYVRLMLTSMLGDGTVTDVDEVEKQMIERKGEYWEEAKRRADVYLSARLPGSLFLHQVNEFAQNPTPQNASGIPQAFFLTMFPAGMIPEGEQKLRDIAPLYQQAWKEYNMGNKNALNEFEDKYPEYRVRRQMFKDNDTMLKGFLVDQIWEKWTSIPSASRPLATSSLGSTFETSFLQAKAYDNISNETLAAWSLRLGGLVPDTKQTNVSSLDSVPVSRYNPQVEAAVTAFQDERAERFPNFYWQQQIYWATEEDKRSALKRSMPEYFQYLDWRKQYYKANPLVKAWADDVSSRSTGYDDDLLMDGQSDQANQAIATGSVLFEFDDVLKAEIGMYLINGTPLSTGALAELNRLWVAKGKPGSSLMQWLDAVLGLRR